MRSRFVFLVLCLAMAGGCSYSREKGWSLDTPNPFGLFPTKYQRDQEFKEKTAFHSYQQSSQ